jgi:anti-sigma factor RsiW
MEWTIQEVQTAASDCGMYGAMRDVISRLSEQDLAELCALADGTLPGERRAAVEARVAASPELQKLVERQRRTVAATRTLADEPVPASLSAGVDTQREKVRPKGSSLAPRLGLAGALAAALAIVVVIVSGGTEGPTVADAAQVATRPPTASPPPPADASGTRLALDVEGVVFPDLRRSHGWRAVGARADELDGRRVKVVYYAKGARRIAYVIVAGNGLPRPSGGRSTVLDGVQFQSLRLDGRPAVTWRRSGRTCVLIGSSSRGELLRLANWRGGGTLRY